MEPFKIRLKEILDQREAEKAVDESTKCFTEENSDTDHEGDVEVKHYCCSPSKCPRDDKYFLMFRRIIDTPPQYDVYDEFGIYIGNKLNELSKKSDERANEVMKSLQDEMMRMAQDFYERRITFLNKDERIVPV